MWGNLTTIRASVKFLSSPGSCSFEVMPGTLRYINCRSMSAYLSGFQAGSVSSSIGTGVIFMAQSMTRRAMFWTLSSLLLLVLAAVPHVVDAYSMVGRTVAVKTLVRIHESAPQVVPASFLIRASFCRPLLSIIIWLRSNYLPSCERR